MNMYLMEVKIYTEKVDSSLVMAISYLVFIAANYR
jgi:hypothetical protein